MESAGGSSSDQLREYESQLRDVVELLRATPEDSSLLSLKSDLEELIAITPPVAYPQANDGVDERNSVQDTYDKQTFPAAATTAIPDEEAALFRDVLEPPKKKPKKAVSRDFEVPQHLVILDTDKEAEALKKKRAVKALKNKWRERKKEEETDKKQKSWRSFQKKNKTTSTMFSTVEGDNDTKVGVASTGRQLTQTGERKRHNNAS
jgi:hypothetical protein